MSEPTTYLRFSLVGGEYIIGTKSNTGDGSGFLSGQFVENVVIPPTHLGKAVTELGFASFSYTKIVSIFIPSSIKYLGQFSINHCFHITTITFEKNSLLIELGQSVFGYCTVLKHIALPSSISLINRVVEQFKGCLLLACVSYGGETDFSSALLFTSDVSPIVHVSNSYPLGKTFGGKEVIRDSYSCDMITKSNSIRKSLLKAKTYPLLDYLSLISLLLINKS